MRRLVSIARFADVWSADSFAAFLRSRGVDARVEGADPLAIGLGGCVRVVLPEDEVRRARWVIDAQTDATDAEAWVLAAGELRQDAARSALAHRSGVDRSRTRRAVGAAGVSLIMMLAAALIAR